jgi:hypothetical protein
MGLLLQVAVKKKGLGREVFGKDTMEIHLFQEVKFNLDL